MCSLNSSWSKLEGSGIENYVLINNKNCCYLYRSERADAHDSKPSARHGNGTCAHMGGQHAQSGPLLCGRRPGLRGPQVGRLRARDARRLRQDGMHRAAEAMGRRVAPVPAAKAWPEDVSRQYGHHIYLEPRLHQAVHTFLN